MRIVEQVKENVVSLPAKAVSLRQLKSVSSPLAMKILKELASKPNYPMALAKKFRLHEQKIYYHIRKMESAGVIGIIKRKEINGTTASFYAPIAPALVLVLEELKSGTPSMESSSKDFLAPIVENGSLNGIIIVGSPDPHGPSMVRSRDGYYGIDLALFLGTFLTNVTKLHVRLDTEVRSEDLQQHLIVIGGPAINTVADKISRKLPIFFERKNNWAIKSSVSGKTYYEDECGIIVKAKNPFNPKRCLLFIAGKRHSGTRAVTIAFSKHFQELIKGNKFDEKVAARVVEGLDKDADGIVDDAWFVE